MDGEDGARRDQERRRRQPKPLDRQRLEEMAVRYVSRFATTRVKLETYLRRKLRERGWNGEEEPDLAVIAARFVDLGYVDDAAFARAKATSLSARGYGFSRVRQALAIAGVSEEDSADAREVVESEAVASALRFAQRRRLGPFAEERPAPETREKALAALVRAGHSFALARLIVDTLPGETLDAERLLSLRL